jgi:hypothetical protein
VRVQFTRNDVDVLLHIPLATLDEHPSSRRDDIEITGWQRLKELLLLLWAFGHHFILVDGNPEHLLPTMEPPRDGCSPTFAINVLVIAGLLSQRRLRADVIFRNGFIWCDNFLRALPLPLAVIWERVNEKVR